MKIATSEINDSALSKYGIDAVNLINEHKYDKLAELFGYALAYSEEPEKVIEKEINSCLAQAGSDVKFNKIIKPNITIKYFEPNSTNLIAVVECLVPIENGAGDVLVELIVAGSGNENSITLEQISYAA